ncbi:MAG: hypothetical protein EP307_14140, partial [Rhodobacteraceae bacterium]
MKPDFALSLSFEGIALLVRAAGGWRNAGEVSLDAPDLGGALAALRARAVDLGGAAFRTKLIIPKDQIRYLTISTGHLSAADRHAEVRRALDGATPYAVDELSYDICEDGPLTHVAAVARETLEEAEAFAVEHRFNPVSFVAIPGDENFLGEPFFGATAFSRKALAPGERVEPDGVSVVVIGPVGTPGVEPLKADAAPEEPATEPTTEPATEAAPEDTGPMPGFSSRRAADGPAPPLGGATRTAAIAPRITVGLPAAEESAAPPSFPDPAPSGASIAAPAATRDVPDAPVT